jgi:Leucine-rich repeat (LRR) protein
MSQLHTGLAARLIIASTMLQAGCTQLDRYDITINDVTVYEPNPLLAVEAIEDLALERCLQQTLTDAKANELNSLESVNCSDAGIASLAGLEQFNGIRSLKLSGNAIRNLLVLERLTELEQLWLDNNNIVDPIPVLRIPSLRRLDLADNPKLQCPALAQIPLNMQVTLPDHCDAS